MDENNHSYYELTQNPRYHWNPNYSDTFLRQLDDISYIVGSSGNRIMWETILNKNASYNLYRDSDIIETGVWEGGPLLVDIDGLGVGIYNFTLVVTYDGGLTESGSVRVIVFDIFDPHGPLNPLVVVVAATAATIILWAVCDTARNYRK
jgi:hypothetical protein